MKAITENPALAVGVNVAQGAITYQAVAEALGYEYIPVKDCFQS